MVFDEPQDLQIDFVSVENSAYMGTALALILLAAPPPTGVFHGHNSGAAWSVRDRFDTFRNIHGTTNGSVEEQGNIGYQQSILDGYMHVDDSTGTGMRGGHRSSRAGRRGGMAGLRGIPPGLDMDTSSARFRLDDISASGLGATTLEVLVHH